MSTDPNSLASTRIRECKTEDDRIKAIDYCLNLGLPLTEIERLFDWYHPTPEK